MGYGNLCQRRPCEPLTEWTIRDFRVFSNYVLVSSMLLLRNLCFHSYAMKHLRFLSLKCVLLEQICLGKLNISSNKVQRCMLFVI